MYGCAMCVVPVGGHVHLYGEVGGHLLVAAFKWILETEFISLAQKAPLPDESSFWPTPSIYVGR